MNIYDKLNDLVRAISQSREYNRYKEAALKVDANETHADMLKEFIMAQMQISSTRMFGGEPTQEMIEGFNTLYTTISTISDIAEFLAAQQAFMTIMNDITKEVSKAAEVEAGFLDVFNGMSSRDEE